MTLDSLHGRWFSHSVNHHSSSSLICRTGDVIISRLVVIRHQGDMPSLTIISARRHSPSSQHAVIRRHSPSIAISPSLAIASILMSVVCLHVLSFYSVFQLLYHCLSECPWSDWLLLHPFFVDLFLCSDCQFARSCVYFDSQLLSKRKRKKKVKNKNKKKKKT